MNFFKLFVQHAKISNPQAPWPNGTLELNPSMWALLLGDTGRSAVSASPGSQQPHKPQSSETLLAGGKKQPHFLKRRQVWDDFRADLQSIGIPPFSLFCSFAPLPLSPSFFPCIFPPFPQSFLMDSFFFPLPKALTDCLWEVILSRH